MADTQGGVTYMRDDYARAVPEWDLVGDVCDGQRAVKGKKAAYLPIPNPTDNSPENAARYAQYLDRAVFYGATGRTLQGLVGAAFRKAPQFNVPTGLEYMGKDADGSGVSIYQQSQSCLAGVLQFGRMFLFADYPQRGEGEQTSRAQQAAGLIRASLVTAKAKNVINWRTVQVGGVHRIGLVVIEECYTEISEDGFSVESKTQYRVLKLEGGFYKVEIWRAPDKGSFGIWSEYFPRDGAGRNWEYIPGTFVGAENNDTKIDRAPLADLAHLNIAHYRNSADYEDSAFMVGQPQPWVSGLTEQWRDWLCEKKFYVGSRSMLPVPTDGAFGFAQVEPNTMVKEAMDQKERQMVALGARLIQPGSAVKTATEVQSDNEAEHSVLSLAAENVSEAYTMALQWAARFENVDDDVEYSLNQEFVEARLDAQLLTALITGWQAGRLPSSDLWTQLRKYGVIDADKTDEEIREELETEGAGLNLDDVSGEG